MSIIISNLQSVHQRIEQAAERCGRDPQTIQLVAVSKTVPATRILEAYRAGQIAFAENYLQESVEKITQLNSLQTNIEWHFIGPIQRNKTRNIAQLFSWVHTVERLQIAQRLSEQRPEHLPALNICLQVNTSKETSKSGVNADEVLELAQQIAVLPRLKLRGLMTIPAPETDAIKQQQSFKQLRLLLKDLQNSGLALDTLSMGMSADLEAAIAQGATMVRIGTAIFGDRVTSAG